MEMQGDLLESRLNLSANRRALQNLQIFLEDPNNKPNADDVVKILTAANFPEESYKSLIIQSFLENPNNENNRLTVETFVDFLGKAKITDESNKSSIIESFLKNPNNKVDADGVVKILTAANITDERYKSFIIQHFLKNPNNENNRLTVAKLSQLIRDTGFTYRTDIVCNLYKTFAREISSSDQAKQLSTLASTLYPTNETLQVELFKEAIDKNLITKENIIFLNLDAIKEDNSVLTLLAYAVTRGLLTGEKQILELVKGRTYAKYDFLKEVIGNKSLDEGLTADGLDAIKGLFGND